MPSSNGSCTEPESLPGKQTGRSPGLPRRSNLESSDGFEAASTPPRTTIDAIGQGQYLVRAFGLHESAGLHNAHAALRQQESSRSEQRA